MLATGTTLGPYTILGSLGAGGMGEVYRAHDTRLGRDVAIKVLPQHLAATPEARARFEREARTISQLNHPHICTLHDVGHQDGIDYLVMELLEGETLARRLQEGALPIVEVLAVGRQIAEALDRAHRAGIVHRDLKPTNVMLTRNGAKLLDFGLARKVGIKPAFGAGSQSPTAGEPLTAEGTLVGTLQYMAPEQLEGRDADARSDIFAFGAMLHEMASGRKAFEGQSQASLIAAILTAEPASLSSLVPIVPPALEHVVHRCLAKAPDDRWQTMRDVVHELEWVREQTPPVTGRSGAAVPAASAAAGAPRTGRRSLLLGAAALLLMAAIATGVMYRDPLTSLLQGEQATPQQRQWTLVAEFDGPADDPGLASAARELVISSLDQSTILRTLPRDQVQEALRLAGRPESTRVAAEVARELAYRSAVRTVVSGRIDRVGAGYPITLRVHDVEGDSLLVSVRGVAGAEEQLIPTLDRLAQDLRREMGERPEAIAGTRATYSARVSTPSFEAYRKRERGLQLAGMGDWPGAIVLYREALALDPDFAAAYITLGISFSNLGQYDSATTAYRNALSRPQRLSDLHRGICEAEIARFEGDLARSVSVYTRMIAEDSSRVGAWANRALRLYDLGRFDEFLDGMKQAVARNPVAPRQVQLYNLAWAYLEHGLFAEAEALLPRLRGAQAEELSLYLLFGRGHWTAADNAARAVARRPASSATNRSLALRMMAAEAIARGELADGLRLGREEHAAWREMDPQAPDNTARTAALLARTIGTGAPELPRAVGADAPTSIILTHAIVAATRGDTARARELLNRALARPAAEVRRQGATPVLVRALIDERAERWAEVVTALDSIARQPIEYGDPLYGPGRAWPRVLVGEAYERLGQLDSAAVYLELLLPARTPPLMLDIEIRRALSSYSHYHLTLLYARMGRREEAESHWKSLSGTLTNPDPQLRHWLDEARAAVAGMRGQEKGARSDARPRPTPGVKRQAAGPGSRCSHNSIAV